MIKLNENQKLQLKSVKLISGLLWWQLFSNVFYEYQGPLNIWNKTLNVALSDDSDDYNYSYTEIYKYFKENIYGDFKDEKPHSDRPLFFTSLYTIVDTLKINKLVKYFPVEYRVSSRKFTNRYDYKREKLTYRLSHQVASEGKDLKEQYYEEYKYIANKYNWPFIVNSDDPEY